MTQDFGNLPFVNSGNKVRFSSIHTRLNRIVVFSFLILVCASFTPVEKVSTSYNIAVAVKNIRNSKGTLQIQVYRDQPTFKAETPYKVYRFSKSNVKDGMLLCTIKDLPKGTYGLALLDDENSNKKMDYGMLLPKEGFGFSDYYHTGWSRPVFDEFKFHLSSDKKCVMVVRYV